MISLCLALLAAAPEPASPPKPLRWEVPHVLREVAVPETLFAADYPVHVRAVQTRDRPEDVIRFFLHEWQKAGLFIAPPKAIPEPMRSLSITALDTKTLVSYTVIFQVDPRDGLTTAITTETFMGQKRSPTPPSAALFPGAAELVRSGSEGIEVLTYTAPASSDEVGHFYRDVLSKAGYRETRPLVFERNGAAVEVVVQPGAQGKATSSRVSVFQRVGGG